MYIWKTVQVHWCPERVWVVRFDDGSPLGELHDVFRTQAEAIEEAKLYAFDTSCGPARAPHITVYKQSGGIKYRQTDAGEVLQ